MVIDVGVTASLRNAGKRVLNNVPFYSMRYLSKAVTTAMDFEKMRRGIVTQQVIETVDKILEQPAPYALLKKYANGHPMLRVVHGAIIREVVKHRWNVKEKFAKKCLTCGQEFKQPVDQCPDCLEKGFLRDPNPQEKKRLEAFLDDPNRDDELIDIIKALLKDELALDDSYISISEVAPNQFAIYNEDGAEIFICANKHGRLGNKLWFCPSCWSPINEKTYPTKGSCDSCGKPLKETAYVQKQEGTIKARFGRDEIIHFSADKWLPHQYGNSKVMSVLVELRSALAMNSYNFDLYTSGHLAKIIVFPNMKQEDATKIAKAVKDQSDKIEIDQWTGRIGRKTRNIYLGGTDGASVHDVMPDSQKMQSLDWLEFWFVKIIGAIYGVQPIMMNAPTQGPGGYFQRMQIVVQNDTSIGYQNRIEDRFNNILLPKLQIQDWEFKFNPIEPRNEMEACQIWQVKIAAGTAAVVAGLTAEITEEGELKISGKFVKPMLPPGTTHTLHQVPQTPEPPKPKMTRPFSMDKQRHPLNRCMMCKKPPEVEVLWAEGHAHAWFCKKCFEKWKKQPDEMSNTGTYEGDIVSVRAIKDGKASKHWRKSPLFKVQKRWLVSEVE